MPLRDYTCPCGHHMERLESTEAPAEFPCPKNRCRGTMKRGLAAPAFNLKGSGFYDKGRSVSSKVASG